MYKISAIGEQTKDRKAKTTWVLAVILVVLGVLSSAQGFLNAIKPDGSGDLQWGVSRHLLNHENPHRLFVFPPPVYPSSAEIFLWPLAALDFDNAKWLWAVTNIGLAIGCVVLVARIAGVSGVAGLGLLGLFLAGTPVRTTIGNGQHGLFSFFFFLLAIDLQQKTKTPLAGLCLAASWLKYTITLPLSLVFIRREWRTTFAIACTVHIGLTVFLAFWTGENPLELLLSPFLLSLNAVITPSMFDVIAIAKYIGVSSLKGPASVGIALFIAVAVLMFKSENNLLVDLSLLSLVSVIWSCHWQYDYFVLIIPLAYALKHWQQGAVGITDMLIVLSTFLIWFVQRIVDSAVVWFPESISLMLAKQAIFWVACLTIYAALVSYFIIACQGPSPTAQPRPATPGGSRRYG
jgi:Glycosyltransferase family 87